MQTDTAGLIIGTVPTMTDDDQITHGLVPTATDDETYDDGARLRAVHAEVEANQVILSQLMPPKKAQLMSTLLRYLEMYRKDEKYLDCPMQSRDHLIYDRLGTDSELQAYAEIAPALGPAPDAEGIRRIIQRMIDAAAGDGGPIVRDGNTLLPGSAGPRFAADCTPTERLVHLLLYHADHGRPLNRAESQGLFERQDQPLQAEYRTVQWFQQRIGCSLATLYDALRRHHAKGVTEQIHCKAGMLVRLRVAYTFQAAEDRAMWCHLRDQGLLPIERETVIPGEKPWVKPQMSEGIAWFLGVGVGKGKQVAA